MQTERVTAPIARAGREPDSTVIDLRPTRGDRAVDVAAAAPAAINLGASGSRVPEADLVALRSDRGARRVPGLKATMVALDLLAVSTALFGSIAVYTWVSGQSLGYAATIAALSVAIWPVLFAHQGLYRARHLTRRIEELRRLVNATLMGVVMLAGISVVLQVPLSRGWLLSAGLSAFCLVAAEREVIRHLVRRRRAQGRLSRRVVLVGDNTEADELVTMLQRSKELGYDVVGRVSDHAPTTDRPRTPSTRLPYLGATEDVVEVVRSVGACSVIVATTGISLDEANRLVRDLTREGIYVELSSAMRDIATRRVTLRPLGRYPVMCVEPVTNPWRSAAKRVFDVVAASLGLLVITPVLLAAAAAIRLSSGRGAFFTQTRVGRNGQPFTVYKLRTMVHDAEALLPGLMGRNEAAGPMFKMADDPRVTPVGHFLRKTSIDELPQLLNVIKGDMSLVGPRPALPHEAVQWNDDLKERLRVKPGMTGNWQVNGRFTASLEDYQRLDLYYVDNWSLVTDLVILTKTIPSVLRRNGAA
jgi:exopolysaccharide biosynthesis polyprenyl glycosylphosphotransferase